MTRPAKTESICIPYAEEGSFSGPPVILAPRAELAQGLHQHLQGSFPTQHSCTRSRLSPCTDHAAELQAL